MGGKSLLLALGATFIIAFLCGTREGHKPPAPGTGRVKTPSPGAGPETRGVNETPERGSGAGKIPSPGAGPEAPGVNLGTPAPGVRLGGTAVEGMSPGELRALLGRWHREVRLEPRSAHLDRWGSLVPEIYGAELDVEATFRAALSASPGEDVLPVFRLLPPPVSRHDFPPAPIRHGHPFRQAASLAINVAWGEENLEPLLDLLSRRKVRATFCLSGRWVDRVPELAREIAGAGHEVASHGYEDDSPALLGPGEATDDLRRSQISILKATGRLPSVFSPHRGELSPQLLSAARALGMESVLWTVDSRYWMKPDPAEIISRLVREARPGSILLFHPTGEALSSLEAVISGLERKGLRLIPVGELISPYPRPGPERSEAPPPRRPER